ncbi:hypothetical protein BSKO_10791 [Bryopsis sp. KO-2023]|nr:hypothetical protein BSKO_10791 [Bryopsis sp. KO-2023]
MEGGATHETPRRIAVVGSGISGLSASWLLNRTGASVTLFEKDAVCGGHTLTDATGDVPVDLGFQVYNLTTYPNLVGFLQCLGVDTEPSDMSFGLSLDSGDLEWASDGLNAVFAQRSNVFRVEFLRMVSEVVYFGRHAPKILEQKNVEKYRHVTLGDYISEEGYSELFRKCYLLPMCAAVWSVPFETVLNFPVSVLVRFWVNHHLLDILQRPRWRVVKGTSQKYVDKVLEVLQDVRTGDGVVSVRSLPDGRVSVRTESGIRSEFDAVILATHSDTSLEILSEDATAEEKDILGKIPYEANDIYLHTDAEYMPKRKGVWSCWNFIGSSSKESADDPVCVTYWANKLQNLPDTVDDLFVTLNPPSPPEESKTIRKLVLKHPVFSHGSVDAQDRLHTIQGKRGVYFAGAWCGYGFHEDGIKAGIEVAQRLGASVPWVPRTVSPKVSLGESMYMWVFDRFAKSTILEGKLRLILPNGEELHYGNGETNNTADKTKGAPPLQATLRLLNMNLFKKCILRHDTGLGEAYMDGDFEVDNLGGLMAIAAENVHRLHGEKGVLGILTWIGEKLLFLRHLARPNTVEGSRRNIEEHYDAGNDMYKLFLDESMTYSGGIHRSGESLYQAQMNKLDALIEKACIKSTDHVLEIGCGWGSFSIRAAQTTGCRVTGLTISQAQLKEAQARVKVAGLEDKVNLIFCDYRNCPGAGTYDKVVSCEMIEAVGKQFLDSYFATIGKMLKPGGIAVLQAISTPDERYDAYCSTSDFIREHVFPGGHLLCLGTMIDHASKHGMSMSAVSDIGADYAVTLRGWRKKWREEREDVLALGYDEVFWRKYDMYFAYCEAGFDAKYIRNYQVAFRKHLGMSEDVSDRPDGKVVEADSASSTDQITQVLLAIYFFLAGLAVSYRPYLWVTPMTSAIFATLLSVVSLLSKRFNFFLKLDRKAQLWWCNNVTQLVFSLSIATMSLARCRLPSLTLAEPHTGDGFSTNMICIAMGFAGFQVWDIVRNGLFRHRPWTLLHFTVVLCLFASAAYKREHTSLLAVMLTAEWWSVFHTLRILLQMAGCPSRQKLVRTCAAFERLTFVFLRAVPHFWVLLVILANTLAFTSTIHYYMALGGIIHCNIANLYRLRSVLKSYDEPEKLHIQ